MPRDLDTALTAVQRELLKISEAFTQEASRQASGQTYVRTLVTGATYQAQVTEHIIAVQYAGAVTITLPLLTLEDTRVPQFLVIDESGDAETNIITVNGNGKQIYGNSQTLPVFDPVIGGHTEVLVNSNFGSIRCYYSGTAWYLF